ncbi:UbiD family decarboxylase [Thalassobacillus sp. CUG 92003]|uniref:UbiD family decarboxylase n=1 Tax=Thalassobacillus sp. CUG 92003 TaxID=2736641 RepID=UPI0015E657C9|nr:UbiD family decarboxylase [Thalassobacillus sp. CUG 92003]
MTQDMRAALNALEEAGRITTVNGEVQVKYELPAVLSQMADRSAVIFRNVKGYSMAVIGNLVDRENFALACGIEKTLSASLKYIDDATNNPIKPTVEDEAPCREIVITDGIDIMKTLPVNTFFEKEAGPYISAGMIVAKDPETGKRNVSINRLLILDSDLMMIGMSPSHHLHQLLEKALKRGESLGVSISIGNHPAVLVASNAYLKLGDDEFEIAGGMFKEPLKLSPGVTVDAEAPAGSEIVIEAEFIPGELHEEGLVSEFHGLYVDYGKSPLLKVKGITHRKNPLYQTILPGRNHEHFIIGAMAIETTTFEHVRTAVPRVKHVYVTEGGMGRVHCVISLSNPKPGEGQKAAFAAFAHCNLIKRVIVVDDDIQIDDPEDVEWAVAARMRTERDIITIPGVRADRAEPLVKDDKITKTIMIALKESEALPKAEIPKTIREKVKNNWEHYQIK